MKLTIFIADPHVGHRNGSTCQTRLIMAAHRRRAALRHGEYYRLPGTAGPLGPVPGLPGDAVPRRPRRGLHRGDHGLPAAAGELGMTRVTRLGDAVAVTSRIVLPDAGVEA